VATSASWARYGATGSSTWSSSIESAASQAEAWTERVASAKGWRPATLAAAGGLIVAAADSAETALGFWQALGKRWGRHAEVDGWDKLGKTWSAAAGASTSKAAEVQASKLGTQLVGTASLSAEDVAETATWGRTWGPYVVAGLLLVAVVVLAWKYSP
jgi:hypothetical protein